MFPAASVTSPLVFPTKLPTLLTAVPTPLTAPDASPTPSKTFDPTFPVVSTPVAAKSVPVFTVFAAIFVVPVKAEPTVSPTFCAVSLTTSPGPPPFLPFLPVFLVLFVFLL